MANRVVKTDGGPELPGGRTTGDTITAFAEDLGKLLGNAQAKAEGWLGQRTQIAKTLEGIRDTASQLLVDLGHQAERIVRTGRRGRKAQKAARVPFTPPDFVIKKRRTMSAKARAAISAAQKARWAKQKAAVRTQ